MKVLLIAFDPFGGESLNPAQEAVRRVDPAHVPAALVKLVVPTVFGASLDLAVQAIRQERPDVVLAVGQAGGRAALTPERVAINLADAALPDNAGNRPNDVPVVPGGPAAYFATLPLKAIVTALRAAGLPAEISDTAGTFVCNHLMYGILHTLAAEQPAALGGFLHVPYIPAQTAGRPELPSLPLEAIVQGIEVLLQTALARPDSETRSDTHA